MPKQTIIITIPTVPTAAGSVNGYGISPGGVLVDAVISGVDALAANATNILSFALKNKGRLGSGNTDMLSTGAVNSTNPTGGSALGPNAARSLTPHPTRSNRDTRSGDRLQFIATGVGTLANTVTELRVLLTFSKSF